MIIVGIDEVGRGCWAGPLVAGAVILIEPVSGLRDSKKLSARQRSKLAAMLEASNCVRGLGWVWPDEIDAQGLTWAVREAMIRAIDQLNVPYDKIIIDGNYNFLADNPLSTAVIQADEIVPAVSAASILAKVARDTYMITELHTQFPQYHFDRHVGYGTKLHRIALEQYGAIDAHRKSYKPIKEIVGLQNE